MTSSPQLKTGKEQCFHQIITNQVKRIQGPNKCIKNNQKFVKKIYRYQKEKKQAVQYLLRQPSIAQYNNKNRLTKIKSDSDIYQQIDYNNLKKITPTDSNQPLLYIIHSLIQLRNSTPNQIQKYSLLLYFDNSVIKMNIIITSPTEQSNAMLMNDLYPVKSFSLNTRGYPFFSNDDMTKILDLIKRCRNLESLALHMNNFDICNHLYQLLETFKCLQNLTALYITLNFQSDGEELCEILSKGLKSLRYINRLQLQISNSHLNYEQIKELINGIKQNQRLIYLDLDFSFNEIEGDIIQPLLYPLTINTGLEKLILNLQNNKISGDYLPSSKIPELSSQITSLSLYIGDNKLGNKGVHKLVAFLCNLSQLNELSLSIESNQIGTEGISQISNCLSKMKQLARLFLQLGLNQFDSPSLFSLGNGFKYLINLNKLRLDLSNSINIEEGLAGMIDALSKCRHIQILDLNLNDCELQTESVKAIFNKLQNFNRIKQLTLSLEKNMIDSGCINIIGQTLKQMHLMTNLILTLDNNRIDSTYVKNLGQFIKQETSIQNVSITSGSRYNKLNIQYFDSDYGHSIFAH